jgi:hypothetical protein
MNKPKTDYFKTRDDGVIIVVTRPCNGKMIRQIETGSLTDEAHDVGYKGEDGNYYPSMYTYASTEIDIVKELEPIIKHM